MDRLFILKEVFYKRGSMFYPKLISSLTLIVIFLMGGVSSTLFSTPSTQSLKILASNEKPVEDSLFAKNQKEISLKGTTLPLLKSKSRLQKVVDTFRKSQQIQAISVAIASNLGEVVLINSGEIDKRARVDVTSDTYFKIGKLTTSFTACILAKLVEDGRVSLDDPVSKYLSHSVQLPTFQENKNEFEITLRHLATHTSGLPQLPNEDLNQKNFSRRHLYKLLEKVSLKEKPGVSVTFSNVGYALLADVLEQVTRKSMQDLYKLVLLDPLKIEDLIFSFSKNDQRRIATGHQNKNPLALSHFMKKPRCLAAAEGAFTTTNEMVKWLKFLVGTNKAQLRGVIPLLKSSCFQGADGVERTLCFEKTSMKREDILEIFDVSSGFSSYLGITSASKLGIAILSNSNDSHLKELSKKLREVLF